MGASKLSAKGLRSNQSKFSQVSHPPESNTFLIIGSYNTSIFETWALVECIQRQIDHQNTKFNYFLLAIRYVVNTLIYYKTNMYIN